MGSGMPAPQNFTGSAERQSQASQEAINRQTQANRPDQFNPYASTTWQQGPGGEWTQSTQFTGPMGELNQSLQQQAAQAMGVPFSLSGLPQMGTGEEARQQAINAAYGQATARMDPQWQQREEQARTRLMNQGLQPGSEAFDKAMEQLGTERTDAYNTALNAAIGQGTAAGQALFGQNLAARQNALNEALRQRGQALSEIQAMNPLTQQQGFQGAGLAESPNYLGAAGMQGQQDWQRYMAEQQRLAQIIGAGGQLGGTALSLLPFFLSDERAKQDVQRLPVDALRGVPMATWRYLPEYGDPSVRYVGVVAQDLQRVAPQYVHQRSDGLLTVHPAFAPRPLHG